MQLYFAGRQHDLSTVANCCAWCLLCATSVLADTLPNAGSLQQSIPAGRVLKPSLNPANSMPPLPGKVAQSGGARFVVSKFKWVGNSLYADQVLDSLTSGLIGQAMDLAQLEAAATVIANHYRSSGYVVQTRLPAQDIVNGVVTIEITEAVFGKVVMDGPSSKRVDVARIQETILAFQAKGDKLNANNIDRALAVLSDLSGIRVQGYLMQGAVPGQTDFMVTSQDSPASSFDTLVDNAGARSTGQARLGFNWSLNSPLQMGDQLTINALVTSGSDYIRTAYRRPWGHAGVSLGMHASRLNYKTRLSSDSSGVANSLDLMGRADSYGLDAIYPLARRNRYKLDALMAWDLKTYLNQRDQQVDTRYETRALNAGLQGHFADAYAGGGFSTWQVMGTGGNLQKKEGEVNQGRFHKVKYSLSRTHDLTPSVSVVAAFSGQASKTNLDASEKMYLGGMTGVRAYPSSEVGGSSGQLLNLEMRHRLNNESTWFVFYDHGQVHVNPSSNDALNQLSLQGVGLGYGFVSAQGISLKAILARRLGQNPNPTATGQDQDGSLVKNRFWLSASMPI